MNSKTVKSVFMTIIGLFLFAVTAFALQPGDINGDGYVRASDARDVLRVAAKLDTFNSEQFAAADIDSDGYITASDARKVLRVAAKLDEFEVPTETTTIPVTEPTTTTEPKTEPKTEPTTVPVEPTTEPKTEPTTVSSGSLTPKQIYAMAKKYTVEINVESSEYYITGSGFCISDDGIIVTNYHVIDGAIKGTVKLYDGKEYDIVKVIGYDKNLDIAIIKIDAVTTAAKINSDIPETGDIVYTLGSSQGLTDTFTNGIVSNPSRLVEDFNDTVSYIQITAPITDGNSGGPLINDRGEVIGINTWGNEDGQNMNFAIPTKYVENIDRSRPMTFDEILHIVVFTSGVEKVEIRKYGSAVIALNIDIPYLGNSYTLKAKSSSNAIVVSSGFSYKIISGEENAYLSISSNNNVEDAVVTVSVEEAPELTMTIHVTVSDNAGKYYFGSDCVPDYGILAETPSFGEVSVMSIMGDNYATFTYDSKTLNSKTKKDIANYKKELEANGFELVGIDASMIGAKVESYYCEAKNTDVDIIEYGLLGVINSIVIQYSF